MEGLMGESDCRKLWGEVEPLVKADEVLGAKIANLSTLDRAKACFCAPQPLADALVELWEGMGSIYSDDTGKSSQRPCTPLHLGSPPPAAGPPTRLPVQRRSRRPTGCDGQEGLGGAWSPPYLRQLDLLHAAGQRGQAPGSARERAS